MVDEAAIRGKVERRVNNVNVQENWRTPGGNQRRSPMYEAFIRNEFLGKEKVIKGKELGAVRRKTEDRLKKWNEQEIKQRISQAKKDAKKRAQEACEAADGEAKAYVEQLDAILEATLDIDDRLDWNELLDKRSPPPFQFDEPQPRPPNKPEHPQLPKKSFFEWLIPSLKEKRFRKTEELKHAYAAQCNDLNEQFHKAGRAYQHRLTEAKNDYDRRVNIFRDKQNQRNQSVMGFKKDFEGGASPAIVEYLREVFERSEYPEGFYLEHQVAHDPHAETVVVDVSLPSQDELPDVKGYKFIKSRAEKKPVKMKKKERNALYDAVLHQTVLRTIHEAFEALYTPHVNTVVVNGWVTALNKATGHDETSCVISVSADREEFEPINLSRVDPSECLKNLTSLVAGPLSQLAPVKPIMKIDREDGRFVESQEVLAEYNSKSNLAEMPWEEFEHLVRELFSEMFSGEETDVRVTQASSDGGVDAIAFDPDPIRGGKFVIQAKRYTNVVPVSAVRDLYGTMISEGATKGLLVTTAYFGRESRRFAQEKPISLIDGSNLVYLLEDHGHKVRLDVQEARAKRRAKMEL